MAEDLLATTEAEHQVECGLLLDVVIRKGAAILKLLTSKDQTLLVRGDALLVLDLRLHVVNSVGRLNLKGNGLASQGLHEDLHPTPEPENQVKGGLLLDVVVSQGAAILQLLAGEDEALLVRGDTLLVLDLGLHVVDRVRGLDLKRDGLAGQGLDEDLHTTPEPEHKVEGGLLLDVVVGKGAAVLQLLASEDETLLVRGDALLVLDLGLHIVDRVRGLDLKCDGLASQGLDEDLHTSPEPKHKVEGGFLLDVVVGKGAAVLQLLAGEDETLLVRGDALLVLDLGLHVVDRVRGLDLEGDGLAGQGLDEDLHTSTEPEHKVEGGLLLDVVVSKGAAILQLLAGEDETLLVWGDALLVLDLGLDIVNGVRRLDLKGDGLASQGLDEDLHASPEPEHKVEGGLLLDVVVGQGAAILKLLASKDETLLVRGDALLVLDLGLDIVNGVRGLNLEGDGLAGEGLHKDLHLHTQLPKHGQQL
jgi:hypothetical protein